MPDDDCMLQSPLGWLHRCLMMTACFSLHQGDCIDAWWWLHASVSIRVTKLVPDDDCMLQPPSGWLNWCLMMTTCFGLHHGDCIGACMLQSPSGCCIGAWRLTASVSIRVTASMPENGWSMFTCPTKMSIWYKNSVWPSSVQNMISMKFTQYTALTKPYFFKLRSSVPCSKTNHFVGLLKKYVCSIQNFLEETRQCKLVHRMQYRRTWHWS